MADLSQVASAAQTLNYPERRQLAFETAKSLNSEDQKDLASSIGLPNPSPGVTDKIWMIVVLGFVAVLLGAFATMAYYYATKDVNLDKMLTVFTTVSAFLAGLLAPSPVNRGSREGS